MGRRIRLYTLIRELVPGDTTHWSSVSLDAYLCLLLSATACQGALWGPPMVQVGKRCDGVSCFSLLLIEIQAAAIGLLCVEIIAGAIWAASSDFPLKSGTVAIVFSCAAAFCTAVMTSLGHRHATQSSMVFSIYLSIAFVFEIARSRSFFLRGNLAAVGALTAVGTAVRILMVVLEELPKPLIAPSPARSVASPDEYLCKEATSGFWNRTMLLWINPTLLHGFRQNLEMEHLAGLGPDFSSEMLSIKFEVVWAKSTYFIPSIKCREVAETDYPLAPIANKASKYALVKASIKTLLLEFLMPAVPRLSQAAFNFALPWLMQRVLSFVRHKEQRSLATGGGLVGAAVFIYFGTAVSEVQHKAVGIWLMGVYSFLELRTSIWAIASLSNCEDF